MTKPWRLALSVAIFFGFIVAVQLVYGWATLLAPWCSLSWASLIMALLLMLLSYALRAWRFYSYFDEISRGFLACLRLMLQHNLWNNLLPMRSGEISFPLLMKSYFSVPTVRSVSALAWFRVMDLHTLSLFAIPALFILLSYPYVAWVIMPIWLMLPWLLHRYISKRRQHLSTLNGRIGRVISALVMHAPESRAQFFRAWGLTLLNWVVKLLVFSWVLMQFGAYTSLSAIAGVVGGELTSVLPVNGVAGVGTYEGGVASIMMLYGYPFKEVFLSAINLHLFILGATCISGLLSWFLPKKMLLRYYG